MNVGKSSQLEKHDFGSLHNITWVCYDTEDFLLQHGPRFTNEVACISLNSLLQDERSAICSSEVVLFETLFTFITYIYFIHVTLLWSLHIILITGSHYLTVLRNIKVGVLSQFDEISMSLPIIFSCLLRKESVVLAGDESIMYTFVEGYFKLKSTFYPLSFWTPIYKDNWCFHINGSYLSISIFILETWNRLMSVMSGDK